MNELITYLHGMAAALEFANNDDAELLQEMLQKIIEKADSIMREE